MRCGMVFMPIHAHRAAGRSEMSQTTHSLSINAVSPQSHATLERKVIAASICLGMFLVGLLYLVSHAPN